MFDLLRKKISSFTEKIKGAIEKKAKEPEAKAQPKPQPGEKPLAEAPEIRKEFEVEKKVGESLEEAREEEEKKPAIEAPEIIEEEKEILEAGEAIEKPEIIEEKKEIGEAEEKIWKKEIAEIEIPRAEVKIEAPKIEIPAPEIKKIEIPKIGERKPQAKISLKTKLKSIFAKEIEISEGDVSAFLSDFELALLESDVEQETATAITERIRNGLLGRKIGKKEDITSYLKNEIRTILQEIMETRPIDLAERIKAKKPFVILFLGLNGAGKTTSIAKLTYLLQKQGRTAIWAASDTFRAAAIEQLEKHAEKLNVRVIKHKYGADPAAVAFDAIAAANANKIDVVMIDSAGRQETNRNLMEELKKIVRVAKPDLKIFVGEALAGKALLQQAEEFEKAVGIDAFILAKIDTDTKGGTSISLLHKMKKPIAYIGTGQGYEDLIEFAPSYIIDRIVV